MSRVLQQKCHRITSASNLIFTRKANIERDLRNSSRITAKTAEKNHENLIVEDLEGNLKTPFSNKIPRYSRKQHDIDLVQEAKDLYNHILDDVLAGRDLNVYQGADFQDFFLETEPKRVSEVCLVNDHFMLVKMPDTCWRRSSQIDSITEEEVDIDDVLKLVEIRDEPAALSRERGNNKTRKYFRCNRSTKVSPIHDHLPQTECAGAGGDAANVVVCNKVKSRPIGSGWLGDTTKVEVHKTITKISGSKMGSLNGDTEKNKETEVFQTITKISGKPRTSTAHNIKVDEVNGKLEKQQQTATAMSLHSPKIKIDQALVGGLSTVEMKEECAGNPCRSVIYNSSLHDSVSLKHNGTLITPRRKKHANGDNCETEDNAAGISEKRKQSKNRPHFNALRWLLKPFRSRNQRKPKVKIHAVINKTYFVRWKRPPDDLINGFGVKTEVVTEIPILRRCRSATF